jgi:hypothetical protein
MNLLEMVLNSQNGQQVKDLGRSFGISEGDVQKAVGQLMPALSRGIQRNAASGDGLNTLAKALKSGKHERYLDRPEELGTPESVADGNAILGHILGTKDVSRKVAAASSGKTGIDEGILKKMLPMVAAMAMGALSKKSATQDLAGVQGGGGSGAMDMLNSFLDADKDGSAVDDIIGLAGKFFK